MKTTILIFLALLHFLLTGCSGEPNETQIETKKKILGEWVGSAGPMSITFEANDRVVFFGGAVSPSPGVFSLAGAEYVYEIRKNGVIKIGNAGEITLEGESIAVNLPKLKYAQSDKLVKVVGTYTRKKQ